MELLKKIALGFIIFILIAGLGLVLYSKNADADFRTLALVEGIGLILLIILGVIMALLLLFIIIDLLTLNGFVAFILAIVIINYAGVKPIKTVYANMNTTIGIEHQESD